MSTPVMGTREYVSTEWLRIMYKCETTSYYEKLFTRLIFTLHTLVETNYVRF